MGEQLQLAEVAEMDRQAAEAEHAAFVEKFKPKLTTDDCYTPANIMDLMRGEDSYDQLEIAFSE